MVGFRDGDKTGISWVNNMVNRGYVSETLRNIENGKVKKEFHLTNKIPDYDFKRLKEVNKKFKAEQKAKEIVRVQEVEKAKAESNLVITLDKLTITTNLSSSDIVRLIIELIK